MPRLARAEVERIRRVRDDLATLKDDGESVLPRVLSELRAWLRMEKASVYGLRPTATGLSLGFRHEEGFGPQMFADFGRWIAERPRRWGFFDPLRPDPSQRNVAMQFPDFRTLPDEKAPPIVRDLYPRWGIHALRQLRALVCDGDTLLAWIGGYREERFTPTEVQIFNALVPDLRRRLQLEKRLDEAEVCRAAMAGALEALPAAAFVVGDDGAVLHANQCGQALLDRDRSRVVEALAAVASPAVAPAGKPQSLPFHFTRLEQRGQARCWLAVQKAEPSPNLPPPQVAQAAARWELTPRQTEVLELVARGLANKVIAAELHCAPSTVEVHVRTILEKAGVDSRAALIARLYALA
jgi:DNA-binding NarL/FixJ family response regulator